MRLNKIAMRNFRPYFGEVVLNLPNRVDGELFLVHGQNGFGKTSMHMAIQWVLYGEGTRRQLYDHANTRARAETDFVMSVALTFSHEGHDYWLLREAKALREPVEAPEDLARSSLTLYRDGTPLSAGEQEVAQERIEHIVPRDASQFFFFDGEQIGRYSSSAHTDETRRAIELVLGLRAAQNARDDAASLKAEVRRQRNKALQRSDQHSRLISQQESLEAEVGQLSKAAEDLAEKVKEDESQRSRYRSELDQLTEVQALASERDRVKTDADRLSHERDELVEQLKKESRGLYLRVMLPQIVRTHDECEAYYERLREQETGRKLEEAVSDFLEKLELESTCVCGEPLTDKHRSHIRSVRTSLVTNIPDTAVENETLPEAAARLELLRKARVTAEGAAKRFEELKVRKVDLDDRLSGLESKLATIHSQIKSIDIESVNSLRELVDRLEGEITMAHREHSSLEQQIIHKREELAKLDKQIAKVGSASAAASALDAQIQLLERAEKAFDEYLVRCARARREQIEEQANTFFKQITNKEHGYDSMFIADDFTFGLRASDGTAPNMDQIAAGEKQVVAFSFIMGLNRYARAQAPLMIDTPMGRLDKTHRRNLAQCFAGLDQQVFLFVTDTDIEFGVQEILEESLEKEFEIVHDQATLTSKIEERAGNE